MLRRTLKTWKSSIICYHQCNAGTSFLFALRIIHSPKPQNHRWQGLFNFSTPLKTAILAVFKISTYKVIGRCVDLKRDDLLRNFVKQRGL